MDSSSRKNEAESNCTITGLDSDITGGTSSRLLRFIPSEIDVLGFYLEPKQFCILILLATAMLGSTATILFFVVLGLYTMSQRISSSTVSPNRSRSGKSGAWAGNRIKTLKDLPKPSEGG